MHQNRKDFMANPFKALGDLNQLRKQAQQMQKDLAAEEITVERGDIVVVISGDQKIKQFSVQGITSQDAIDVLNEAIKKSQELAAKKLQSMTGGLGGMLGGQG
jgi:DNA-binding protein YbaB